MRYSSRLTFLFVIAIFSVLVFATIHKTPVSMYVTAVKSNQSSEALKEMIAQRAQKENQPAINARTDKIWGNIPGLDGLVIDQEATFQLALNHKKQAAVHWIYKIIEPKVSLEDLQPHPIYRGNPDKKAMSLMINVAWGTEHLPSMLDTLKKYGVQSTFYLDGSWANKNRDWVKKIYEEGHEIGNHAYSHPNMSTLSEQRMNEEIVRTERVIKDVLGHGSTLFAPPSGDFNALVVKVAHNNGMKTIMWTLDTVDWQKPSPDTIINRIVPKAENGALVLMHPTASTAQALPAMIEQLQQKGYELMTVSETLSAKRFPVIEELMPFW